MLPPAATVRRFRKHSEPPRQPSMIALIHPFDLQILKQLGVRHSDSFTFLHGERVCLDLGRGVYVFLCAVEEFSTRTKLLDMTEFMDDIQVQGAQITGLQVVAAHDEVTVDVARPHVAKGWGEKLDLEPAKYRSGLLSEQLLNWRGTRKPVEESLEREEPDGSVPLNPNSEARGDHRILEPPCATARKAARP
jgi:hypothetical protein